MAILKAYATHTQVEEFLNQTITLGLLDAPINSAVNLIDQITGRNFLADTSATARQFCGSGEQDLEIDECVEITKVERGLDDYGDSKEEISAGGLSGYYLLPANYSAKSLPIQQVRLRDRYWLTGFQNHQITAKWGFSATPPAVIGFATAVLAAGMYNYNRGGSSGNIKSEKIGNYSVTYDNQEGWDALERAREIIETYKRYRL